MAYDNKFAIRIILIACAGVILVLLVSQFNKKQDNLKKVSWETPYKESYENSMQQANTLPPLSASTPSSVSASSPSSAPVNSSQQVENTVKASEPLSNEDYKAVDFQTTNQLPSECYPRDKLTADDLLPKDAANSKWAEMNPAGQGDVRDKNFLNAGYHIGIDTVGQSLRNANYQLRSDPPNPKLPVGPWNQTTIEYDQGRRYFEINNC